MDYSLSVQLRNCITSRAHLYGAEALILDRQVERQFLPTDGEDVPAVASPNAIVTSSQIFYELVKRGIADRNYMLLSRTICVRDRGLPESLMERQWDALPLAQQAREARLRYWRELEAVDLLGGYSSPFTKLDPALPPFGPFQ